MRCFEWLRELLRSACHDRSLSYRAFRASVTRRAASSPGTGVVVKALDDVSLSVEPGRVLGIVGESGSGKSSLLRAIVGLNRGYTGTIYYRGEPIDHAASAVRRSDFRAGVQMIFQIPAAASIHSRPYARRSPRRWPERHRPRSAPANSKPCCIKSA